MTYKDAISNLEMLKNTTIPRFEEQRDVLNETINVAIRALECVDRLSLSGRKNGKNFTLYSIGYRDGTIDALHVSADNVKKALTNEETIRSFEEFSKAINKIMIDAIGLEPPTKPG